MCRYNAIHYNTIFNTAFQLLRLSLHKLKFLLTKDTPIPRLYGRAMGYGVAIVSIFKKIDSVLTTPHCTLYYSYKSLGAFGVWWNGSLVTEI